MPITRKDMRGNWKTEEEHEVDATHVLMISTRKISSGSIVTSATVHEVSGSALLHRPYTDFNKRIGLVLIRATSKAIEQQHAFAIREAGGVEKLLGEAKAHTAALAMTATEQMRHTAAAVR